MLPRIEGWPPRAEGTPLRTSPPLRGEAASRLRIWLGMLLEERISEPPPRLPW
jgi:hypothetical protein